MSKIKSVILIDNCDIDNFINHKLLEYYGVLDIHTFKKAYDALIFLRETTKDYQLILIGVYMPMMSGFEFIDEFQKLDLHKKHGKIILLSAFFSPIDKEIASTKNINLIEKPLTIENLILTIK
jgi:CheY-like chemotaxis protein